MLSPEPAPVKPRVFIPHSVEVLPLEEVVCGLVAGGVCGCVFLHGAAGSGKTTALRHLVAVLPSEAPVIVRDEDEQIFDSRDEANLLIIWATSQPVAKPGITYRLAPWAVDDVIEYLLAKHREHCTSVMSRLRAADRDPVWGIPELWRVVLDEMAGDASIADGREAIRRRLQRCLPKERWMERARYACLGALIQGEASNALGPPVSEMRDFAREAGRLLRHVEAQVLLAAERLALDLRASADCDYLERRLPRTLIRAAGVGLRGDRKAVKRLRDLMTGPPARHAMAASLLLAVDPAWVPEPSSEPRLAGAYLDRAAWSRVELPGVNLREANLSHADLRRAHLDGADAYRANLSHARLAEASVNRLSALEANLAGADLSSVRGGAVCWDHANLESANLAGAGLAGGSFRGTNLTGAVLTRADLTQARFEDADLTDADFSGADLSGACLTKLPLRVADFSGARFPDADLSYCNMEGMDLPGINGSNADFCHALLTETVLTDANLHGANLRGAGLGDVNMERACLREADLREATFHMGSSRSGLRFTPIASEGTRTGFYTDDADEMNFKSPEEIRKANLRGADLRGALIDGVDFYLVDLREALYDAQQEQHFRRCRAILDNRTEDTA